MQKSPRARKQPRMSRGMRSSLVLGLFCVLGTAFATWVTFEMQDPNAWIPDTSGFENTQTASSKSLNDPDLSDDIVNAFTLDASLEKRTGTLKRNSNPLKVLRDLGAEGREAYLALEEIYKAELVDPRRLNAGLTIDAFFDTEENKLQAVGFRASNESRVISKRLSDGSYFAAELAMKLQKKHVRVANTIQDSFYLSAQQHGLDDKQISDFAQIFAFDVDFQREIRNGDSFELLYEVFTDENGNPIRTGEVIFAAFHGNATKRDYYRYIPADDQIPDYFTPAGKAATRFLMKTPINGARLSSSFGRRRHPISGYTRLHKGTDFAARTGTPIMAAGNGVVERASRYGGYGHYVRVQHANGYETAYAHMHRYGPGIKSGKRVRQGDIVGYVGSTGASTGPHLHYEVLINGKHVNAQKLKLPTGRTLEGDPLKDFTSRRDQIDKLRRRLGAQLDLASTTGVENG